MHGKRQVKQTDYPHIVRVEGVLGGQPILEQGFSKVSSSA